MEGLQYLPQEEMPFTSASDQTWTFCPVPDLSDIVVDSVRFFKGPEIVSLLENATRKQALRMKRLLPLDVPLKYTLPLPDMEVYWKRQCLERWPSTDACKHDSNWKKMFIENFVKDAIQNFIPEESDISELKELLQTFSTHRFKLIIQKLRKKKMKDLQIDLKSDGFDYVLDEFLDLSEESSTFVDFKAVLSSLAELEGIDFAINPSSLDQTNYRLPAADFNSLLKGLKTLQKLEEFRCINGLMSNEQLKLLCRLFLNHCHLRILDLSHNFFDDSCCNYLAKLLLCSSCHLEHLLLKNNKVTSDGAQSIAAGLSKNKSLIKLDLSLNSIDDEGGEFLATVLCDHETMEDLDMSRNKLRSSTALAFATCLIKSKSLRKLNLTENNLGTEAGAALREAVESNELLHHVGLEFCQISRTDEDLIRQFLIRNRLRLSNSPFKNNQDNFSEYVI